MVAIVLALLTAIENFFFIPYYPWWSLLTIAVCIWVMWALTRPDAMRQARGRATGDARGAP